MPSTVKPASKDRGWKLGSQSEAGWCGVTVPLPCHRRTAQQGHRDRVILQGLRLRSACSLIASLSPRAASGGSCPVEREPPRGGVLPSGHSAIVQLTEQPECNTLSSGTINPEFLKCSLRERSCSDQEILLGLKKEGSLEFLLRRSG